MAQGTKDSDYTKKLLRDNLSTAPSEFFEYEWKVFSYAGGRVFWELRDLLNTFYPLGNFVCHAWVRQNTEELTFFCFESCTRRASASTSSLP